MFLRKRRAGIQKCEDKNNNLDGKKYTRLYCKDDNKPWKQCKAEKNECIYITQHSSKISQHEDALQISLHSSSNNYLNHLFYMKQALPIRAHQIHFVCNFFNLQIFIHLKGSDIYIKDIMSYEWFLVILRHHGFLRKTIHKYKRHSLGAKTRLINAPCSSETTFK